MRRFLRRLFCRHRDMTFLCNIHGDEINDYDGHRSWWRCDTCGFLCTRKELVKESGDA